MNEIPVALSAAPFTNTRLKTTPGMHPTLTCSHKSQILLHSTLHQQQSQHHHQRGRDKRQHNVQPHALLARLLPPSPPFSPLLPLPPAVQVLLLPERKLIPQSPRHRVCRSEEACRRRHGEVNARISDQGRQVFQAVTTTTTSVAARGRRLRRRRRRGVPVRDNGEEGDVGSEYSRFFCQLATIKAFVTIHAVGKIWTRYLCNVDHADG